MVVPVGDVELGAPVGEVLVVVAVVEVPVAGGVVVPAAGDVTGSVIVEIGVHAVTSSLISAAWDFPAGVPDPLGVPGAFLVGTEVLVGEVLVGTAFEAAAPLFGLPPAVPP